MGRPASAAAAQPRHDADLRELPEPGPRPPGTRYASAQLAPQPAAAAHARRLTRDWLARWDMGDLTDDAQAIASELAANALAAIPPGSTGLAIIYAVHATPAGLRIYAWDIGPGHPAPAAPAPDAESGRGLAIVDALTGHNWGWWPTPASGGKVIWAQLPAPETPQ
jgi:anti-sigma regulatory factor (Ser/Thr protein kinase)